jgi:hypothetical protein
MAQFEADLDPQTKSPRIRFNFPNGWTASIVLRLGNGPFNAYAASVAAFPTGHAGEGVTEIGETEATASEVTDYLAEIRNRPMTDEAQRDF